ncbi:MAG: nucleoside triphosphate pyrophosphohydrolase [Acidobacteriaceae bacterium]
MAEVETSQMRARDEPRQEGVGERAAGPLAEAIAIMARLRAPGGCPWDREQTFDTIKRYTLEETYEVFDAIERHAWPELKDELGDLLLQILFYAQMASEAGHFDIADVAANLNAKLVRRHPHVFPVEGKLVDATDADAVLRNWEQIKRGEKRAESESVASVLDEIPRSMPALMEARKLGSKAAKAGFDWPDAQGTFEKLQEEIAELQVELARIDEKQPYRVEEEVGDLLFTAVNLARHLKVDAESALRVANAKFRERFCAMEAEAGGFDALASHTPAELDALWNRAKRSSDAVQDGSKP